MNYTFPKDCSGRLYRILVYGTFNHKECRNNPIKTSKRKILEDRYLVLEKFTSDLKNRSPNFWVVDELEKFFLS